MQLTIVRVGQKLLWQKYFLSFFLCSRFLIARVYPMLFIAVCGDGLTFSPTTSWSHWTSASTPSPPSRWRSASTPITTRGWSPLSCPLSWSPGTQSLPQATPSSPTNRYPSPTCHTTCPSIRMATRVLTARMTPGDPTAHYQMFPALAVPRLVILTTLIPPSLTMLTPLSPTPWDLRPPHLHTHPGMRGGITDPMITKAWTLRITQGLNQCPIKNPYIGHPSHIMSLILVWVRFTMQTTILWLLTGSPTPPTRTTTGSAWGSCPTWTGTPR